jgi:hypothetical protein
MKHSIDYTIVWNDAMEMMRAHREALLAMAGILLLFAQLGHPIFCRVARFLQSKAPQ